ncbi:MAG: hypothetical protein IH977_14735 [Nitrospinae bacterium]|nr:hypothetical protein [Nitrospinota bacterium]
MLGVFIFPLSLNAVGSESSPTQVVQHWLTVYPKDLNTAVTLTTPKMRNDLTPERWIRHSKGLLLNLGLEYLDGQVLSEEITGNRAVVMLKAYLSTTIGEQVQRERYTLRRINGQWLIDEVNVVVERFLGEVM